MSRKVWAGQGPALMDTSAWIVAGRDPAAGERLERAVALREVRWCWPVRYELTVNARSDEEIALLDRTLEGLQEVPVDRGVQRGVLSLMRDLAATGSHGAHRFPLTDLTVAVAAQSAGLPVVHRDHHLERLATALGIDALWITAP